MMLDLWLVSSALCLGLHLYIYYTCISIPEIDRTTRDQGEIEGIIIVTDRMMVE
jgi:hypothetical protein